MTTTTPTLNRRCLSLDHQALTKLIVERENILIIQDLDGVCLGLVKDPLTRVIKSEYLQAAKLLTGHFYVLTNGEHIGTRGVNMIVEKALGDEELVKQQGLYLPGLAAGGVQWQDCYGRVEHPGVSDAELAFLAQVPSKITAFLQQHFQEQPSGLSSPQIQEALAASVLDNLVSPTANLNTWHQLLQEKPGSYLALQQQMQKFAEQLLQQAASQSLDNSFFIHYAPNLGRDRAGNEIIQFAQGQDSGTTDFQFMLRGAIKEVGVLVILNRYYYQRTGNYPLGENFNVRQAPRSQQALLELVQANFDPAIMPTIIGIGDTVTSKAVESQENLEFRRGGSDRGFLELIQALGREFQTENTIVYVDSSQGEVKNRQPLTLETTSSDNLKVIAGPGDIRDTQDPLTLNVVFPGGHQQYVDFFCATASQRQLLVDNHQ